MKRNTFSLYRHANPLDSYPFGSRLNVSFFLLVIFWTVLGYAPQAHAKKEKANKHKIKVEVLQNKEHNDCLYTDEVIIRVKYKLKKIKSGTLSIELTEDNAIYYEVGSIDVERRKGKVVMTFDAGECATDMRVVVK